MSAGDEEADETDVNNLMIRIENLLMTMVIILPRHLNHHQTGRLLRPTVPADSEETDLRSKRLSGGTIFLWPENTKMQNFSRAHRIKDV